MSKPTLATRITSKLRSITVKDVVSFLGRIWRGAVKTALWVFTTGKRFFASKLATGLFVLSVSFHILFWVIDFVRGGEPMFIVWDDQVVLNWISAPDIVDYFAREILNTLTLIGTATFLYLIAYTAYLIVTGKILKIFEWLGLWWENKGPIITNVYEAARVIYPHQNSGTFLTMIGDHPIASKKTKKLTFTDDRHVTMIASSRAGKGRSISSLICCTIKAQPLCMTLRVRTLN